MILTINSVKAIWKLLNNFFKENFKKNIFFV